MLNFVQSSILEMIELYGEEKCQNILSSFHCPLNQDVENFLHNKAISFTKQYLAMTFLVFITHNNQLLLVGYYTLANKFLSLSDTKLSKTIQKKSRHKKSLVVKWSTLNVLPIRSYILFIL